MDFKTYLNSSQLRPQMMDFKTYLNSSQLRPQMMYYQYMVPNTDCKWCIINTQFPIHFYELKYDFTVYEQFFYDDLVPTILPYTIYSHTMFPAPTYKIPEANSLVKWCKKKQKI